MDELIDEFKEGRVIFIRWNPDHYLPPSAQKGKSRKQRLQALSNLLTNLSQKQWTDSDPFVSIYYMFYSRDNPVITERFHKVMIY